MGLYSGDLTIKSIKSLVVCKVNIFRVVVAVFFSFRNLFKLREGKGVCVCGRGGGGGSTRGGVIYKYQRLSQVRIHARGMSTRKGSFLVF